MCAGAGTTRRRFGLMALGAGGAALAQACSPRAPGEASRALVVAQANEPTSLNTALSTAAPATFVASKLFEPLLRYDFDGSPLPNLAERWEMAPDGLSFTFHLRRDVRWHDGTPFTAADVAYSLLEVWKTYHARSRTTFANVEAVETPEPHVAILRLSQPAPYLLSCLGVTEGTILPRHLYEGTELLTNPLNHRPVGNGPFRFVEWRRANEIVLERNPDYWDQPRPYLERIIVRFLPNAASAAMAVESGAVDIASALSFTDVERLGAHPELTVWRERASYSPNWSQFEFNLDRPALRDVRVRQAFAHAIDRDFIARNIHGDAEVADSPVPAQLAAFHAPDLPRYDFDLARANALLDQAGLAPGPDGVRLRLFLDFSNSAINVRTAAHMRSTLAGAGVAIQARAQDQGEYINRVYTRRDFDTCMTGSGAGLDPAIGVQRYYWSKNVQRGVAFSNGANYVNPEVDRLLEEAQVELDPERRRALYHAFQRIAMTELPYIPLVWSRGTVISSRRVRNLLTDLNGLNGNFADVSLED